MKTQNIQSLKRQKGFSIIEVASVIIVIAMLAYGAKVATDKMRTKGNLEAAKAEIQTVIDNADRVNPNSARYNAPTALSIDAMNDRNLVPEEWGDGTAANVYGGDITATPLAGNPTRYTVTYTRIPNDEDGQHMVDTYTNVSLVAPTYAAGTLTLVLGLR